MNHQCNKFIRRLSLAYLHHNMRAMERVCPLWLRVAWQDTHSVYYYHQELFGINNFDPHNRRKYESQDQ